MFGIEDMERWLQGVALPAEGADYLREVVRSPPQRAVSTRVARNVSSHYPSRKMGQTTQSESWTGERQLLLELEYNAEVLRFWDQPPSVRIEGTRRDGKSYRNYYTSDFLALFDDRAIAYEVKPRASIESLIRDRPSDWLRHGKTYVYRPARVAFERLGIRHVVRCAEDFNQVRTENLNLMLRSQHTSYDVPPVSWHRKITRHLSKNGATRVSELLSSVGTVDIAPLVAMIHRGELFTDIDKYRLADPRSTWIAVRPEDLQCLERMPRCLVVAKEDGLPDQRAPKSKDVKAIANRLAALEPNPKVVVSRTTTWRYRRKLRDAGGDVLALRPNYHLSGRRGSRLHPRHDALIQAVLRRYYRQKDGSSISGTYAAYCCRFIRRRQLGLAGFQSYPVCDATFRMRLLALDQEQIALARGGPRAANAAASPTDPLARALRPLRPFEKAHLDHWLCDCYCVVLISEDWVYVARPWATFLVDSATSNLLALVLSFGAPSRKLCARILRECVRVHGRLPETIMTDSGAEFRSNFFHGLAAKMEVELINRPVSMGRWGQEVERAFGQFKQQVLSGLPGYLSSTKDDRGVSRRFRADQHAKMELSDLHRYLQRFRTEWFNAHPRGNRDTAASVLLREGLASCSISGVSVANDEDFAIATAVPLDRKHYRKDGARGIRAQDRHYAPHGKPLTRSCRIDELRVDPENLSVVYAHSAGLWIPMYAGGVLDQLAADLLDGLYRAVKLDVPAEVHKEAALARLASQGSILVDSRREFAAPPVPSTPAEPPRTSELDRLRQHVIRPKRTRSSLSMTEEG